jgi:hypothetical protein
MGDAEKARQALKAAVPVRSHMAGPQPRFPDEAGARSRLYCPETVICTRLPAASQV